MPQNSVEAADVMEVELQYLYSDGDTWNFMDESTYEQFAADRDAVGDAASWLKEQDVCTLTLWNGSPIAVAPPNFVTLEITETEPGVRGDTASGATKPAKVETGAEFIVPGFIKIGNVIKVDSRTGEYVERVSN